MFSKRNLPVQIQTHLENSNNKWNKKNQQVSSSSTELRLNKKNNPKKSKMTKKTKLTKNPIVRIELEFILTPLNIISQALVLWKRSVIPDDVYLKMIYQNGDVIKMKLGQKQIYDHNISIYGTVETLNVIGNVTIDQGVKIKKKIKEYSTKINCRSDTATGAFFWAKWCRSDFSDFSNDYIIYQPHHFILKLLNAFYIIVNQTAATPLLNISENLSLLDFYNNCKGFYEEKEVV